MAAVHAADYVPGEVLVKFRDDASVLGVSQVLAARRGDAPDAGNVSRVEIRPGETVEQVVLELQALPEVEFAEPNYIRRIQRTPNDPEFGRQWALRNTGQLVNIGPPVGLQAGNADIGAIEAWDTTTGSRDVVVAVVDTGIDLNHPDLVDNLWSGPGGVRGHDFVDNDGTPNDDHGHGTSVAGVIGARGGNGLGIAGTAWEVSLMPVRAFGSDGQGDVRRIVAAIDFARERGAHVINASFGANRFSMNEYRALQRAEQAGILIVAAACNEGADNDAVGGQEEPCYPASYDLPNIIAVAATDNADALLGASNYGATSVDLGAPGVSILSLGRTRPTGPSVPLVTDSGTSIAAAFVTGAAALLLSHNGDLDVAGLRAALLDNVDPASNLAGRTATGGRLNVARALGSVPAGPPPRTMSASGRGSGGGGGSWEWLTLLVLVLRLGTRRCAPRPDMVHRWRRPAPM